MIQAKRIGIYGTGKAASQIIKALENSPHSLTAAIAFLKEQDGEDIGNINWR